MNGRRVMGGLLAAALLLGVAPTAPAEKLDATRWRVTDEATGGKITELTDNRLDTHWTASGSQGVLIDLGRPTVLHRLYLTPGTGVTNSYRQLTVTFMAELAGSGTAVTCHFMTPTGELWKVPAQRQALRAGGINDLLPFDKPEADLRFNPRVARYLRIEGATPLAEVMAFGSADKAAFDKDAAVVVASNAPAILRVAAEDLRYYIGELIGRPLPVVAPGQEDGYPGTIYRIVDLAPLATNYAMLAANTAAGKIPNAPAQHPVTNHCWRGVEGGGGGWYGPDFPDQVNVEKQGREVIFKAWPYKNVACSVWEFLRQQGVVWAAPEVVVPEPVRVMLMGSNSNPPAIHPAAAEASMPESSDSMSGALTSTLPPLPPRPPPVVIIRLPGSSRNPFADFNVTLPPGLTGHTASPRAEITEAAPNRRLRSASTEIAPDCSPWESASNRPDCSILPPAS